MSGYAATSARVDFVARELGAICPSWKRLPNGVSGSV